MPGPFDGIVEAMTKHLHGPMTTFKFNKSVDSGPLPSEADEETQQDLQNERIRRQMTSHIKSLRQEKEQM
jgi:hypothetical protein